MSCLSEDSLQRFASGALTGADLESAIAHLDACPDCRHLAAALARGDAPPEDSPAKAPRTLGRYVLLNVLGAGAMGVVYRAFDPELDRKVALKLLRPERVTGAVRDQLLREAQAMARVAHPNVLAVHDVGTVGEDVFLAMELVEGPTARAWLEEHPRAPREIVALYCQAGRGLEAAHAAGLVHRDFKPENVLVSRDGRARVTDFGLASRTDAREAVVAGTPVYMAPEQLAAGTVDARSDQFCFCVALWEAIAGERPFTGGSVAELSAAIAAGPRRHARIPARLFAILARGLAAKPSDRYPSMAALLAELEADPERSRRRRWFAGALAVAGVSLVGALVGLTRLQERRCAGAESRLTGVWDADRRGAVERAFQATGKPYAAETFLGAAKALDAWAAQWTEARTDACRATHVRGEQSEALLDLRMACLDRDLKDLSALVTVFAAANEEVLLRAGAAAAALPDLAECSDQERLTATVPPPDPKLRAAVEEIRGRLSRVRALRESGRYPAAVEAATQALTDATPLAYPALEAEALLALGDAQAKASDYAAGEQSLRRALFAAEAARWDELAARAALRLAQVAGGNQQQFEQAGTWLDLAAAKAQRLQHRPDLVGAAIYTRAMLLQRQGRWTESLARCREALPLLVAAHGEQSLRVAEVRRLMGSLLLEDGALDQAREQHQQALALWTAALGTQHPDVALGLNNLGHVLAASGDLAGAQALHQRALDVATAALGPAHPYVANALQNLGSVALARGDPKAAEELARRALTIRTKTYGRWHPLAAASLGLLGEAALAQGDAREALWHQQQALEILQKALPATHPGLARPWAGIGAAQLALGERTKAREAFERALGLRAEHPGEPAEQARIRAGLAQARGDVPKAGR